MLRFSKTILALAALAGSALPALALETSTQVVLTFDGNAERNVMSYLCEGTDEPIVVEYINAAPTFLAFVPIDGKKQIFVNVVSASGARYASGALEWWSKGPDATLTDVTAPEGTAPIACSEAAETP